MTDDRPLKPQPRRVYGARQPGKCRTSPARYVTAEEAAALLGVSTYALSLWRGRGAGPGLKPSPDGWRYDARVIERLAALPYDRRMFAIWRSRGC